MKLVSSHPSPPPPPNTPARAETLSNQPCLLPVLLSLLPGLILLENVISQLHVGASQECMQQYRARAPLLT